MQGSGPGDGKRKGAAGTAPGRGRKPQTISPKKDYSTIVLAGAPYDIAVERAVLGAVFQDAECFRQAEEALDGRAVFHDATSTRLWQQARTWYAANNAPPPALAAQGLCEAVGLQHDAIAMCLCDAALQANLDWHCKRLLALWRTREMYTGASAIARYAESGDTEGAEAALAELAHQVDTAPSNGNSVLTATSADSFLQADPPPDETLIEGLVNCGAPWCVSGQSKAGKSCFLLQTALAMAAGARLLGTWQCNPGEVVFVDLESTPGLLHKKLEAAILELTRAGTLPQNRDYLARLHLVQAAALPELTTRHLQALCRRIGRAAALVVDPLYLVDALQETRDENSAADTARLLQRLKACADTMGATLIYSHHFAKGCAAHKHVLDRAAGSGVHARFASTISTLTETSDGGTLLESVCRGFKQPDPLTVRLEWPVFALNPSGSTKLAGAGGRPSGATGEDLEAFIEAKGAHIEAYRRSVLIKDIAAHFNVSDKTIRRKAKEAGLEVSGGFIQLEVEENVVEDRLDNDVPF